MREPEEHPDAERARLRCGEDRVDRAHVRQDCSRPGPPSELPDEGLLEACAATDLGLGPEEPHARIVGQGTVDRRVGEDDELVHAGGESPELGHGRAEHGADRVDLLRDDHEPHRRTPK